MLIDFANKFFNEDRKYLKLDGIRILGKNYLRIENPQLLAGFLGYLKFQNHGKLKIYFRGERNFHLTTIPGLYRGDEISNDIIKNRTDAYNEIISIIPKLFAGYRFKIENVNPLLQHYGLKTNWIDLVDNLFVAIWFSRYKNKNENGYIKVFCSQNNNDTLNICDLRELHSSLSLRLHCQHGISATKNIQKWNVNNIDFNNFLITRIEIPNSNAFSIYGKLFSKDFIYPSKKWDNTLKEFLRKKLSNKLIEIGTKYNLTTNEIGKIK